MRRSRFTETQIVSILKEAEAGKQGRENDARSLQKAGQARRVI